MNAALPPDSLICAFGDRHRLEDKPINLQTQPFWNQDAIEQIEKPLHQQCQQGRWNRALQDRCVIVQVEAAQDSMTAFSKRC